MTTNKAIKGYKQLVTYTLPIPLYNKTVHIYLGQSLRDCASAIEARFKGLELDDIREGACGYAIRAFNEDGNMLNIIMLNMRVAKYESVLVTCAHECLHTSWDILDGVGIQLSQDNHEAQAYLLDHIFEACKESVEDYIKRYKLKIKP